MEEKENFHREFDKLKQELERTYEMKAKALMDREKNAIDRLQKQQEVRHCSLQALNITVFISVISSCLNMKV